MRSTNLKVNESFDSQKGAEVAEAGCDGTSDASIFQWEQFTDQKP
jgi:hypothetical protein